MSAEGVLDDTQNQTFQFVVWPTEEPPVVGVLADIDDGDRYLELIGQDNFTLRMNEDATSTGYAWVVPDPESFTCLELIDDNLGDFTTRYQQF
jgi:hypothetical protein